MSKQGRIVEIGMLSIRLRGRREELRITQPELGERVGRTKQQIYRYETGEAEPSASLLGELAKALSCTPDYLLGFVDDPHGHLQEADLPPDEQEALAAYRAYKDGNTQRIMTILAKHAPDAP